MSSNNIICRVSTHAMSSIHVMVHCLLIVDFYFDLGYLATIIRSRADAGVEGGHILDPLKLGVSKKNRGTGTGTGKPEN